MTNPSYFKDDILKKGSDHYKQGKIQPIEFI